MVDRAAPNDTGLRVACIGLGKMDQGIAQNVVAACLFDDASAR